MAWNDGSRFLVAHGVKWGTGPKFYKGSKHDTYWNKDLLWKLYVQQESRKHGVAIRTDENKDNLEVIPPFMKSLEAARQKGARVPFHDPYRDDLFKTNTKSARARPVIDRTRAGGGLNLETNRSRVRSSRGPAVPQSGHSGHGHGGARPSSATLRSAGAGISSPTGRTQMTGRTAARLENLERMIMQEGARRRQLEGELARERQARQRTEQEMMSLRQTMNRGGGSVSQGKLQAYDQIMTGLVTALKNKKGQARRH